MIKYASVVKHAADVAAAKKKLKLESPLLGAAGEFLRYIASPRNQVKAVNAGLNTVARGVLDAPASIERVVRAALYPAGDPSVTKPRYTRLITDRILPVSKARRELESITPGLRQVNNFLHGLTSAVTTGKAAGAALKPLGFDGYSGTANEALARKLTGIGAGSTAAIANIVGNNKPLVSADK